MKYQNDLKIIYKKTKQCLLEWINYHLERANMKARDVNDDLADGFYLIKLIEQIAHVQLGEYYKRQPT